MKTINKLKLTRAQQAAVNDLEGVCVINSLAGSGKSLVLETRARNIRAKYPEANIVLLTFNKKCCEEMNERLQGVYGVQVSTIHSFLYNRVLKASGLFRNYRFIATEADRRSLMKKAIYESKTEDMLTVNDLADAISRCDDSTEEKKAAKDMYFELLKEKQLLDYDAILHFSVEVLKCFKAIGYGIRNSVSYLLWDEFQDSNTEMVEALRLIFPKEDGYQTNLCLALDYGQSIYRWRGANPQLVRDLLENYYNAKEYKLTTNHRSTPEIIEVANHVLPANSPKMVAGKKIVGEKPIFYAADDEKAEAAFIIGEINRLREQGFSYNDMAILFRASAVTNTLYETMLRNGIPVIRIGGSNGLKYQNSRFKALLALLNALYSKKVSLTMDCTLPIIGVPSSVMSYLRSSEVMDSGKSLQEILLGIPSLSRSQRNRITEFFEIDVENRSLDSVVELLFRKYLAPYYKVEQGDDTILESYRDIIAQDRTYDELVNHILEVRKRERDIKRLISSGAPAVTMLSGHCSKGAQYNICFVVGATNKIMPLCRADAPVDEEEERNLAYVMASRAEKALIVSYPKMVNGVCQKASPYFEDFFE